MLPGGTTTPFWFGTSISTHRATTTGALLRCGKEGELRLKTCRSILLRPILGAYQVHGNVWEWVEDCWNTVISGAPNGWFSRTSDIALTDFFAAVPGTNDPKVPPLGLSAWEHHRIPRQLQRLSADQNATP